MPVIIEEKPDLEIDSDLDLGEMPPIFGRCPVCKKPLRPRDRFTGEPKAPPVGQGALSRARCDRCGSIIEYIGNGEWVVFEGGTDEVPTE